TSNAILEKAKGVVRTAQQAIQAAEAVVAVRDQEKQRLTALQLELTNKPTPARSVAFSGDGRLLAIASDTGTVQLVDGETGTQLETLSPTPPGVGQPAGRPNSVPTSGPPTIVSFGFVAFSAGAKLHAVGSDGVGVQWRTESSWKFNRVFGGDTDQSPIANRVLSLDFSPDGETLVTAGGVPSVAGELLLWSVREGSLIRQFETGHRDTIQCVRYSPDGQFVATASADRLVKLFRVADGGLVQTFPGHSQPVLALAWRADGRAIVSGGGDQVIKLWNLQTGAAVRTYRGTAYRIGEFRRSITSLAFVGDRDQFVSTSGDKTVRLHRTTNDSDIFAYVGGQSYYHELVFAGGQDGVLHAWNAESTYRQHSFTADEPARLKKAN
ncbi:MAG: WD40 repeat domain-containing protein, partial [Planctomycetota bacterium]|nr:WD40 repeat domain-containing protein [Planctomycetota bacterium]